MIFEHFKHHYSACGVKVFLENIKFKIIGAEHNEELVRESTESEVRRAVWECDSDKSLGPEGVKFCFVKEFWDEMKQDFIEGYGRIS